MELVVILRSWEQPTYEKGDQVWHQCPFWQVTCAFLFRMRKLLLSSRTRQRILWLGGALALACVCCRAEEPAPSAVPFYQTPGCDSYSAQTVPTLTLKQKTCFWRDQLVTGTAFSGAAFWGFIGEIRHKPPEWPQGFDGFGRQLGTRYTQGLVKSTGTFIAGALMNEDPRTLPPSALYCPGRATTIGPRIGQALLRVVWARKPDCSSGGRPRLAPLAGSFASGFISLAWAPPSANKISSALTGTGTAYAGYFGNSIFSEFQGDIFRLLGMLLPKGKKP